MTPVRCDANFSPMADLMARDISDDVVDEIRRRALERGVSPEVEAGFVLSKAILPKARSIELEPGDKGYTLFDHFRKLGEIAPDFEFVYERPHEPPRPLDLE